ncbi:hypothetical protein [Bacillus sp. TL12]|uniref:hypothetical protein n=1 Tax=Bacillus sp. TL12 TaxID=2894756 RepID=UPI001F516CD6|nr:hypothetical protein [Bacillus sp. TL12]MCI0768022.1 hypothetical protein [Bacillus sp. TL12]
MRKIVLYIALMFTVLFASCSNETNGSASKDRELTHDEKILLDGFLQLNHVSWDSSKMDDLETVTGCEGDFCAGPNAFDKKQKDLSGTYYIASTTDSRDPNDYHIFLIIPTNIGKKTTDKTNIMHWLINYRDSSVFDVRNRSQDIIPLGQKLASFDEIMSDSLMKKTNTTYNLNWKKVQVKKDLSYK